MGSSPSRCFQIVMVGLDDAGRTSILNRLHRRDLPKNALLQTLPTIGCTRETVQHRGNEITIWEFGGQEKIRPMWRSYLWQGHAFAFVLDASATDRVKEAKEELVILLKEREYTSFPFLVIANKVDKEGALGVDEIAEALDLKTVFEKHTEWPWTIMGVSALSGKGMDEMMDWFVDNVSDEHIAKHPR